MCMQDDGNRRFPLSFIPIGVIHSPFTKTAGMPIQPNGARGIRGSVEIFEEFRHGLKDIEGFSPTRPHLRVSPLPVA